MSRGADFARFPMEMIQRRHGRASRLKREGRPSHLDKHGTRPRTREAFCGRLAPLVIRWQLANLPNFIAIIIRLTQAARSLRGYRHFSQPESASWKIPQPATVVLGSG